MSEQLYSTKIAVLEGVYKSQWRNLISYHALHVQYSDFSLPSVRAFTEFELREASEEERRQAKARAIEADSERADTRRRWRFALAYAERITGMGVPVWDWRRYSCQH
jgi:hypothetical protein